MVKALRNSALFLLILILSLSVALAACSSDTGGNAGSDPGNDGSGEATEPEDTNDDGNTADADSGEEVEITWLVRTNPDIDDWFNAMVEEFNEEHPNITVELQTVPQDEIDQRLTTRFAGGDVPDVWSPNWADSGFATYQGMDVLLDLSPYIESDPEVTAGIPDEVVDMYNIDGGIYGIPMLNIGTFLFYNKDLFDEAGLDYPTTDWDDTSWDWDAMVDYARQLTRDIGDPNNQVFGLYQSQSPNKTSWLFGGDFFSEEAYETGVMGEPQASANPRNAEAIQATYDLIHEHQVSPNPAQLDAASQIGNPFLTGQIAMIIEGGWGFWSFSSAEFEWGVAAVPFAPNGEKEVSLYVDPWSISKDSEHPDEAWEFLKYINDPENGGLKHMEKANHTPADEDMLDTWYDMMMENLPMTREEIEEVTQGVIPYGRGSDNHLISNFSTILNTTNQSIDAVYSGNMSVEEALEEIDENLRALD